MARIAYDDADLPLGWEVDDDNWGRRLVRNGDCDRLKRVSHVIGVGCFIEDGWLYTMRAEYAVAVDNA